MKQKYFSFAMRILLISGMCAVSLNAQNSDAPSSEHVQSLQTRIIQNLQENVDFLKEHIVDFINKEEVAFEEFDDTGKVTRKTVTTSEYSVFPEMMEINKISDCKLVFNVLDSVHPVGFLREERRILSTKINSKSVEPYFNEPFGAKGSGYAAFFVLFDRQYEKCFDYKLIAVGKINERDAYAVEFSQKEEETGKSETLQGGIGNSWNIRYSGVAWIDAGTMEIVQLNRAPAGLTYVTLPTQKTPELRDEYIFDVQYEYYRVKIKDRFLTLPVAKTVRLFEIISDKKQTGVLPDVSGMTKKNLVLRSVLKYEYSDYKTFNVGATITYGAIDEKD